MFRGICQEINELTLGILLSFEYYLLSSFFNLFFDEAPDSLLVIDENWAQYLVVDVAVPLRFKSLLNQFFVNLLE